jgi:hypothetical protein
MQSTGHRSFLSGVQLSVWPGLFVLGVTWALAWVVNDAQSVNLVVSAALLWFGHMGAANLSGRVHWWLYGTAALVAFAVVVVVAEALIDTPHSPSTVDWSRFAAGMRLRWQLFYSVVAVGVPAGLALSPSGRFAHLARAGVVSALALASFFIPAGWIPHTRQGVGILSIMVVLLAVGTADTLAVWAAARGRSRLVAAISTPIAALGGLVMTAAAFWWIVLGANVYMPGENLEPNDGRAVATVVAVLIAAALISTLFISRVVRHSSTDEPIDHH